MLRSVASRCGSLMIAATRSRVPQHIGATSVRMSSHGAADAEEFDTRYEAYFNKPDIDGWEVRKAMNDLHGMDLIPEPKILIAAMKACRRINDHSLAVRYLEAVKDKCATEEHKIWPFIMQEIQPTLKELGISSVEEMGYDKPELALKSVYDMHDE
ncbi:hypothetical protein CAPTEDRAFT_159268 [Capitella teleta]|uniref:Cytochrome c oxidase subunit 5A, mitochondrial n=2 Tax=Capitella teleta TaxID=283909 RepID=R7UEZ3_CAPTE|nr:hypothetical protein CAPTEDRAFT_159268 [Capitella teleta]|eukprot:ELU02363.1 hypothetical protein CAPTEDRAFT_159268 [Capitella teleta]